MYLICEDCGTVQYEDNYCSKCGGNLTEALICPECGETVAELFGNHAKGNLICSECVKKAMPLKNVIASCYDDKQRVDINVALLQLLTPDEIETILTEYILTELHTPQRQERFEREKDSFVETNKDSFAEWAIKEVYGD